MSLIDRAKAHFKSLQAREVEIPEWGEGGEPAKVYVSPMTIDDRRAIFREGLDSSMQIVEAVLRLAKTADGKPAFSGMDKVELSAAVDARILARIAAAAAPVTTPESAAKN